ncbi:N-acetyllactosaminide beta-1,3-N-acetylglucosaminyltransferase 2 isoform X2 [Esox lucius]|uniref:Hexosyltransferase n=1 Tax=Esox lucius TaxID=8010 RepID=A0AAY5KPB0_ESOLU|nr:N-acetyllactosaminide beta-1,3-N-acetylglucosaminyltransferase 2 isoform X2 [Esox lucius]
MRPVQSFILMIILCSLCIVFYYSSFNLQLAYSHRSLLEVSANPTPEGNRVNHPPFASFREFIPQNQAYWNRLLHFQLRRMGQRQEGIGQEGSNWSSCEQNPEHLRTNVHDFSSYPELHQVFIRGMDCRHPPILINQPEKCTSDGGDTFLLFAIKSTPKNFEQRQAVRETWGREGVYSGGVRVRTVFLLGSTSQDDPDLSQLLAYEGRRYGDLLQWGFKDSFFNLTLKEHVFYRWALTHCPNISFVFKGDDDVFANTKAILAHLQSLEPDKASKLYLGQVLTSASPLRDTKSKYYIPESFYEGPYPAYAGGGGYLFSGSLIRPLYGITLTLPFFPIDDVYSGMCFSALDVAPEVHPGFHTFDIREQDRENVCVHRNLLLVHKRSPQQILRLSRSMKNPLLIC